MEIFNKLDNYTGKGKIDTGFSVSSSFTDTGYNIVDYLNSSNKKRRIYSELVNKIKLTSSYTFSNL